MHDNLASIDKIFYNCERALSWAAQVPVVGIVPGVLKIGMGTIQAIAGLAIGVFDSPLALLSDDHRALTKWAFTHVAHGIGNMVAGALEAIPVVGFILLNLRGAKLKGVSEMGRQVYVHSEDQTDKFMRYQILVEDTSEISGADDGLVARAKKAYDYLRQRREVNGHEKYTLICQAVEIVNSNSDTRKSAYNQLKANLDRKYDVTGPNFSELDVTTKQEYHNEVRLLQEIYNIPGS